MTAFQDDPYSYTWNGASYTTADDPGTERGDVPGHAVDGGEATSLQTFEGYTTDGSFIDYYAEGYKTQFSGGYILRAWARLPNGTKIDYGASAKGTGKTGAIYPTQITDAAQLRRCPCGKIV